MSNPDKLFIPSPHRKELWMKRNSEKDVEYVRKDAFIEKAIEWLKKDGNMTGDFYEDFRKAMKEDFMPNL